MRLFRSIRHTDPVPSSRPTEPPLSTYSTDRCIRHEGQLWTAQQWLQDYRDGTLDRERDENLRNLINEQLGVGGCRLADLSFGAVTLLQSAVSLQEGDSAEVSAIGMDVIRYLKTSTLQLESRRRQSLWTQEMEYEAKLQDLIAQLWKSGCGTSPSKEWLKHEVSTPRHPRTVHSHDQRIAAFFNHRNFKPFLPFFRGLSQKVFNQMHHIARASFRKKFDLDPTDPLSTKVENAKMVIRLGEEKIVVKRVAQFRFGENGPTVAASCRLPFHIRKGSYQLPTLKLKFQDGSVEIPSTPVRRRRASQGEWKLRSVRAGRYRSIKTVYPSRKTNSSSIN